MKFATVLPIIGSFKANRMPAIAVRIPLTNALPKDLVWALVGFCNVGRYFTLPKPLCTAFLTLFRLDLDGLLAVVDIFAAFCFLARNSLIARCAGLTLALTVMLRGTFLIIVDISLKDLAYLSTSVLL